MSARLKAERHKIKLTTVASFITNKCSSSSITHFESFTLSQIRMLHGCANDEHVIGLNYKDFSVRYSTVDS